jgi:dTDP-glucose pyrophosphorylase
MEHIVLLLKKHGVNDICVTLRCMPEKITEYFGDGSPWGVRMEYRIEAEPLGTAGGVKNCMDFCGDKDFFVISGDAACNFDLRALAEAHRRRKSAVTLALYPHAAPLRYGLVLTDTRGYVQNFIEKPPWERVVTDLVNTGIYVISPRAMAPVPEGVPFDFARDLFPLLMEKGDALFGLPMEGYWCDIGDPEAYYRCCLEALRDGLFTDGSETEALPADSRSPAEAEPARRFACRVVLDTPARARLMRELSCGLMEAGADFSDGLSLDSPGGRVRIAPLPDREAIAVEADDPRLAARYVSLARRLDNYGK